MSEIAVRVLPDFMKQKGSYRLRQRFIRLSVRMMELDGQEDTPEKRIELAKLFQEYDELLEYVLRTGCEVEGGTIEEVLDHLSADEADKLFQQVFGLGGGERFLAEQNGMKPEPS